MKVTAFVRAQWDRVGGVALSGIGLLAIVLGWVGVSGSGLTAEQVPYVVSGGLGGIALITIGCTMWLSADLQDEWRRLDELEERLAELRVLGDNGAVPSSPPATRTVASTVPGGRA